MTIILDPHLHIALVDLFCFAKGGVQRAVDFEGGNADSAEGCEVVGPGGLQ